MEQDKIPTSKLSRASKFLKTGAKVGGNYIKYYTKKSLGANYSKEELDDLNAEEIFSALNELKGSALKAAQMLSMDQGFLPNNFAAKFRDAQTNARPLSFPLVSKIFRRTLKKSPNAIFETFTKSAVHAASIGQVHRASIGEQDFAVKVQYPGVADSVSSDLNMAKPLAARLLKIQEDELNYFLDEIRTKLTEETDYHLELERSIQLSKACSHLDNTIFPKYFPTLSSNRILTMEWIEGKTMGAWLASNPSQEERDLIGQTIWDFYAFQIHHLRIAHADPHPGNFIITPNKKLAVIDFGCVKEIPEDFYLLYKRLMSIDVVTKKEELIGIYRDLGMLHPDDTQDEHDMFIELYNRMIQILNQPFQSATFDFGNTSLFEELHVIVEEVMKSKQIRKANAARGSKHSIYINRIYFGLYSILGEMKAVVNTSRFIDN